MTIFTSILEVLLNKVHPSLNSANLGLEPNCQILEITNIFGYILDHTGPSHQTFGLLKRCATEMLKKLGMQLV